MPLNPYLVTADAYEFYADDGDCELSSDNLCTRSNTSPSCTISNTSHPTNHGDAGKGHGDCTIHIEEHRRFGEKKTNAPTRKPPRYNPPNDGRAHDEEWEYSFHLVVRVGPPGVGNPPSQWPEESANYLADNSYSYAIFNEGEVAEGVNEEVMQEFAKLVKPCDPHIAIWSGISNSYEFYPDDGTLQGWSARNNNHLIYVKFFVDGRLLSYEDWNAIEDTRQNIVTTVHIKYRGPAAFVLEAGVDRQQVQFIQYQHKPWEPSPVFGF